MLLQKMPQRHEQLRGVTNMALIESIVDVFDHHRPNALGAAGLLEQVVRKRGGCDFRDVLMLGYRVDLGCTQAAHANAVFHADHHRWSPLDQDYSPERKLGLIGVNFH
jgi:hypothetical protein